MTTPESPPLLSCSGLTVGYAAKPILPPVDLDVRTGELWALIGINGSGKTTLLRTLLGLLPKVGGEIEKAPGTVVSYVPQRNDIDASIPGRVIDLVRTGHDRDWSFLRPFPRHDHRQTDRALHDARCEDLARQQFSRLSEGQKARALLARALVVDPTVLVLDEPTSSVDAQTEKAIFELLDNLRRTRELALIVVTHRTELFRDRATHAIFVDRIDRVAMTGSFDEITAHPAFVRRHGAIPTTDSAAVATPIH